MNLIESLLVDGLAVQPSVFSVPEMSLSSGRAEMKKHSFVLKADAASLLGVVDPAYRAWVCESKRDDELHACPQDELAVAGYPELHEVVGNPTLAFLVLGYYLLDEFIGKFTWDGHSAFKYWLDEVTHCHSQGGTVNFTGYCYSKI